MEAFQPRATITLTPISSAIQPRSVVTAGS